MALLAANVSASIGSLLKWVRNGVANPLVTCSDIPSSIEKMKKRAIFLLLNNLKAFKPIVSAKDSDSFFTILHCGKVRQ